MDDLGGSEVEDGYHVQPACDGGAEVADASDGQCGSDEERATDSAGAELHPERDDEQAAEASGQQMGWWLPPAGAG